MALTFLLASAGTAIERIADDVRAEQIRDLRFGMFNCWPCCGNRATNTASSWRCISSKENWNWPDAVDSQGGQGGPQP